MHTSVFTIANDCKAGWYSERIHTDIVATNTSGHYSIQRESFRNFVMERGGFMRKFGHDAKYYLNQMVIYMVSKLLSVEL